MVTLLLAIIYLAFISLGLPDGLLGAAWPSMHPFFHVPVSYAGIISMVISGGTIVSALLSDWMTSKLGAAKITALSVAMTAIALLGFSWSTQYWMLILWSIPYGIGAGGVDAALNNYVALHYSSRHMSWLHCMWGVGATVGPYIMSFALNLKNGVWQLGYQCVGIMQIVLAVILICSIPIWKSRPMVEDEDGTKREAKPMKLRAIVKVPGVPAVLITFFCYCSLEGTAGLWAASYLNLVKGIDAKQAASMAALFFIGITAGRAINGFLTMKWSDTFLIRIGIGIIAGGIFLMLIPGSPYISFAGIILIGLGCAPVYPCIIHSTPEYFGKDKSQAIVGVQMASAYVGTMLMPTVFGQLGERLSMKLLPVFLLAILIVMSIMHEYVNRITRRGLPNCDEKQE